MLCGQNNELNQAEGTGVMQLQSKQPGLGTSLRSRGFAL